MADELKVTVPTEVKKELAKIAQQHKLGTEKLASVLLEGFVAGLGNVYTGAWPEGPGIRLIPDWPRFSAKVFKLKSDELK